MTDAFELVVGLIVIIVLGFGVGPILHRTTQKDRPAPPSGVEPATWQAIFNLGASGKWIGFFERLLTFGIFWLGAYVALAGWLAFKVAAKWESWSNIVQVPSSLPNTEELEYFRARKELGSWIFSRFLIGTLLNALIGIVGAEIGKKSWDVVSFLAKSVSQAST